MNKMDMDSALKLDEDSRELHTVPDLCELISYSIVAVIGFVGNIVICLVIIKNREMRTVTRCYLFSLAISDLLILIVFFPISFHYLHSFENDLSCQLG